MKLIALNRTDYIISKTSEYVEFFVYGATVFVVPFLIGQPQLLVGTIVNAALILAALNLKNTKLLPIIILPSIAVLMRGIIFGPYTVFLLYLIPFIWIGNGLLVAAMKLHINKGLRLIVGVISKTIFIITAVVILSKLNIVPSILIKSMGAMQLYTVVLGGMFALAIQYLKKNIAKKQNK